MDLNKHLHFFNPLEITHALHIIGVGAIGSHVAEQLIRMGVEAVHIWDFDVVDAHNIPNQMYTEADIGKPKTEALAEHLREINPLVTVTCHERWTEDANISGYIFMCVDSIQVRQQIVKKYQYSVGVVLAIFDYRMRLTDAQHYAARVDSTKEMENLARSMDFTQEEADKATPVSACGTTLAVLPTIRVITALGVANFMNLVKGEPMRTLVLIDAFSFDVQAFPMFAAKE